MNDITPRRFRRGDTCAERPGLVFYTYRRGKEYWTSGALFLRFRQRDNANAIRRRRRDPSKQKAAMAKWASKPGNLELKRLCYRKWAARPEGRVIRQRVTAKYRGTINGTIINRVRSRIAVALKRGETKSASTLELIGCTIQELKQHLESQFHPGMSWQNIGQWEIDHITPLALFDLADSAQQKLAFNFHNCRPMWTEDNRTKSDFVEHRGEKVRARELRKIVPFQLAA